VKKKWLNFRNRGSLTMPIDPQRENLLSLVQAAEYPPDHKRTTNTIRNWMEIGIVNKRTGLKVRLDRYYIGRDIYTSSEAMDRFFAALNLEDPGETIRDRTL
jgi:hypothetical protein